MPLRKAGTVVDMTEKEVSQPVAESAAKPAPSHVYTGRAASKSDTMTKADWAAKDVRISRQGLFQAALQSPALMQYAVDMDAYLALVRKVAEAGLAFVNE